MRNASNTAALIPGAVSSMPTKVFPLLKTDQYDGAGSLVSTVWHYATDDVDDWRAAAIAYIEEWRNELLGQYADSVQDVTLLGISLMQYTTEAAAARSAINATANSVISDFEDADTLEELAAVDWAGPMSAHDITTEKIQIPS